MLDKVLLVSSEALKLSQPSKYSVLVICHHHWMLLDLLGSKSQNEKRLQRLLHVIAERDCLILTPTLSLLLS